MARMIFLPGLSLSRRLRRSRAVFAAVVSAAAIAAGMYAADRSGLAAGALTAGLVAAIGDLAWRLRSRSLRTAHLRAVGGDAGAALAQGQGLLLSGDRPGAERLLGDLAASRPADPEAHLYWGLALREQGDLPGAERVLKKAVRLDLGRKWTEPVLALLSESNGWRKNVGKEDTPKRS